MLSELAINMVKSSFERITLFIEGKVGSNLEEFRGLVRDSFFSLLIGSPNKKSSLVENMSPTGL